MKKKSSLIIFTLFVYSFNIIAQQSTQKVLMVRPANFGYNAQSAASNVFQNTIELHSDSVRVMALREFDALVQILQNKRVEVIVLEDTQTPIKPDAVFPNNWVSFHSDGRIFLYPMANENRRTERREDFINSLYKNYTVKEVIDWSIFEKDNQFLEGTGSIVFDRLNQMAFACESPRTNSDLLTRLAEKIEYKPIFFHATDENQKPIYHTNVMMSIGTEFAVVCMESIKEAAEKLMIEDLLKNTGREIVYISLQQMKRFAGNILELKSKDGKNLIIISQMALMSLTESQKLTLAKYGELVSAAIPIIELVGGGGIRCMVAEMFLKK